MPVRTSQPAAAATPPRPTIRSRWNAIALAAALALSSGCHDQLTEKLEVQTPAQQLRERVKLMREEGFLAPEDRRTTPVGARALFARLDEVDKWLDEAAPWDDGPPAWWDAEVVPSLGARLRPLGPFFEEIENLLAFPRNKKALEQGVSLAYRTTIHSGEDNYDAYATPRLARVQRWVDLLCADAVHGVDSGVDTDGAVARLAQALDLIHLLDDGSMDGVRVCVALETRVLLALRLTGTHPSADVVLLADEIEPRLARIGDKLRLWETLRGEISRRVEITLALLSQPGRHDQDHWLTELDSSYSRLAQRGLDAIYVQDELRNASTLCARVAQFGDSHPFQYIIDGVSELHEFGTRCFVARLALAAARSHAKTEKWPRYLSDLTQEFSDKQLPYLACRSERLVYDREFRDVSLSVVGRYGPDADGSDPDPLLEWRYVTESPSRRDH